LTANTPSEIWFRAPIASPLLAGAADRLARVRGKRAGRNCAGVPHQLTEWLHAIGRQVESQLKGDETIGGVRPLIL